MSLAAARASLVTAAAAAAEAAAKAAQHAADMARTVVAEAERIDAAEDLRAGPYRYDASMGPSPADVVRLYCQLRYPGGPPSREEFRYFASYLHCLVACHRNPTAGPPSCGHASKEGHAYMQEAFPTRGSSTRQHALCEMEFCDNEPTPGGDTLEWLYRLEERLRAFDDLFGEDAEKVPPPRVIPLEEKTALDGKLFWRGHAVTADPCLNCVHWGCPWPVRGYVHTELGVHCIGCAERWFCTLTQGRKDLCPPDCPHEPAPEPVAFHPVPRGASFPFKLSV